MFRGERQIERPFRWGIVGGGRTSGVGYKHRMGAMRDNISFLLKAAAFDVDFARCVDFGVSLGMDPERLYPDYKTMFEREAALEDGIEAVDIATPNFQHYEACKAALEAGLHVICEKPLFFSVEQGLEIKKLADEKNRVFCVNYGYSGFDLIMQMRHMVKSGAIGDVTMVDLRYAHGFGCDPAGDLKAEGQIWRVDPARVGPSFVLGDLSTHTFYISQVICPELKLSQLLCDRQSFIKSRRPLEDNAYVLMRYEGGAVGRMWASAVNAGDMRSQIIRIVGTKASLEWNDMHPDELVYAVQGEPARTLVRGMDYLCDEALEYERLGALHYTGLMDSWANLYNRFAVAMDAMNRGDRETLEKLVYPDLDHGIDGVRWVCKCVESADKGGVWVDFE
ncbi:MAG: Gfo/Idh/MocA family oxidoreductase [Clostridia bacterium]|nr:Gfo/Idh/MocA family oxidoreductase [Clostridia bacterium]